jgi:hypothetical protein
MNTAPTGQGFYSIKQLSQVFTLRGMPMSERSINKYIKAGKIKATRDLLRPTIWQVSHQELLRILNQEQ